MNTVQLYGRGRKGERCCRCGLHCLSLSDTEIILQLRRSILSTTQYKVHMYKELKCVFVSMGSSEITEQSCYHL